MKRFLLIWALFLCSLSTAFAQFSGSGSGTEDDPYLIFYAEQLSQVRNFLNKEGVYFKLMSDIDLSDWISENAPKEGWRPIGVDSSPFKGIFDGNGHKISNFMINRPGTTNVGLLGYAENATIKNITIIGSVIGDSNIGSICGCASNSSFLNCTSNTIINGSGNYIGGITGYSKDGIFEENLVLSEVKGVNFVGGVVGINNGTLSNNNVRNTIVGNDQVGGIIGCFTGGTMNVNSVSSFITSKSKTGGIVGNIKGLSCKISNCSFYGEIKSQFSVGGLIGEFGIKDIYTTASSSLGNSFAICDILASGNYVGGIIGNDVGEPNSVINNHYSLLNIQDCFHSGSIQGEDCIGGIAGYKSMGKIIRCYNSGSIFGHDCVGGIVGKINKTYSGVSDNYDQSFFYDNVSLGSLISSREINIGRIYGNISGSSYGRVNIGKIGTPEENLSQASLRLIVAGVVLDDITDNEKNGTGMSAAGLKLKANYVAHGWDFNNDWTMQETETYPYKPWQAAPPQITSKLVSKETTISGKSIDGGTVYIEVGDNYKSSVACSGNTWSFSVPALQSGDRVRAYVVTDGKIQSPYTDTNVGYPGSGTLSDPYRVYTAADLQGVYKKGYYKLMNDVDLTEWINENSPKNGWPAIGKNGLTAVYFDGGGHTVSGLWCNTAADYNGLFSNFPDGYIKNLNVKVAEGKEVKGGDCTGIVIGHFANGIIDNVTASGTVNGSKRCGGIVGVADNLKISSSKFDGILTSDSTNAILGGIVGEIQGGEITKSQASSTITAKGESTIAGALVGKNNASVSSSFTSGAVTLTGKNSYGGGLIGQNIDSASVENCYSTADATSTLYAAGLVAYNYGKVSNSYSKGNVNSEFYGAGVVGYNDGAKATVNNLVAGNPQVNVTDKSGWSIRVLGGFKNGAAQPGENNYALSTMILSVNGVPKKVTDNILDGYAKTEDELKSEATYEKLGWSFSRVWKIDEANGWPTLDMTVYGLVTSVILDQKTLTLKKGQTATLRATVKPDDATNKTVAWSSSDTSIATVKDGVVRGVGNGKATIIATSTDGTNLSDSAIVTVYAPVNDTIVLKDTTTLKNKTIMYPVYLNNEDPVCSFQLDVYLPDGIDIAKNSKGKYDIQFAGRQEDTHSITSNKISTGAVRVIAFSIANDNFSGKSGALVNIPITIGDVAKGNYNISIRNIVLADASEKEYYCQDANGVIHVNDVIMGDANSDGKVSLADVNSTVNYIAEKPSGSFCFAAADMNNNGIINVSDVNAIVNVLAEVKTPASAKKNFLATANEVTTNDKMYCSNIGVVV